MKLHIRENEPKRQRRNKNAVINDLISKGYFFLDSGYGDWHYCAKKYEQDFDVKGFYNKSDTVGLKMYDLYGKLKDSAYTKYYNKLYDFAKDNFLDNWNPRSLDTLYNSLPSIFYSISDDTPYILKKLYIDVNTDLMNNEGFTEPPYLKDYYKKWLYKI